MLLQSLCGPWCPPFPLRGPENLSFFIQIICRYHRLYRFRNLARFEKKRFSEPHNQRMVTLQTGTKELEKIGKLFVSILTKINPNGAVFFFKDISILSREETCKKKENRTI